MSTRATTGSLSLPSTSRERITPLQPSRAQRSLGVTAAITQAQKARPNTNKETQHSSTHTLITMDPGLILNNHK